MEETPKNDNDKLAAPGDDGVTQLGVNSLRTITRESEAGVPSVEEAASSVGAALQASTGDQLIGLGDDDGYRRVSRVETYTIGIASVERHIGGDMAQSVRKELERIDAIEPNTIAEMRNRGELDPNTDSAVRRLAILGINADHLTPPEVRSVVDYANDATPEIVEAKVNTIYDAFMRHVQGARSRRDGLNPQWYNEPEAARKTALQDKFKAYVDGKLDLERGFDADAVYNRLIKEDGYEESSFLREHLEEDDLEDLLAEGLVDESDLYVYGPFTAADLEGIEGDLSNSWTNIARPRFNGGLKKVGKQRMQVSEAYGVRQPAFVRHSGANLAQLLDETIPANSATLEQDLLHGFVAGEVLQDRRLNSKHALATSAAPALDVIELGPFDKLATEKGSDQYDLLKVEYDGMREATSRLAYYAAELLGYTKEEMKNRFGSSRPISKEFFEEVAKSLGATQEARFEYMDKYFKQTLTKMDEHMCDIMFGLTLFRHPAAEEHQSDRTPFDSWQPEEDFD